MQDPHLSRTTLNSRSFISRPNLTPDKFPNLKFTLRPNLRGEWILTSSDNRTIQTLRTTRELNLTELKCKNKLIKAVVAGFPFSIPASELAKHGKIVHVECLRNKEGQETKAMLCSFIGERPDRIDLGVWGTFPVRTYYPEPLRCYNCQRFEHHKSTCFSETRCAVCSGRHETSVCIKNIKKGNKLTHVALTVNLIILPGQEDAPSV